MISPARMLIRLAFYPSVLFNRLMCGLHIWNQWDWIDSHVLLGAIPSSRQIQSLADLGITSIVNLCEEFAGHEKEMTACNITQLRLPTRDYSCPTQDTLIRGIRFIHDRTAAGHKTYLHCKAGQGRAPTMALCYLMASQHSSAAQAYKTVRHARWHVSRRLDQRPPVLAIERLLQQGRLILDTA